MNTPTLHYRAVKVLNSDNGVTIRARAEDLGEWPTSTNQTLRVVIAVDGREEVLQREVRWGFAWSQSNLASLLSALIALLREAALPENCAEPSSGLWYYVHPAIRVGLQYVAGTHRACIDFQRDGQRVRARFADLEGLNQFREMLVGLAG
jgi:hypothetical protein